MLTRRALIAALAATVALPAWAGGKQVFNTGGVAINGYDPVAYFSQGRPVEGKSAMSVKWHGAIWRFSSEENRQAFEMDPQRYAPAYGGYCAYAMTQGALAKTVPEAFTIHNGRLYLNYSTEIRGLWKEDIPGNVAKADAHWPAAARK